MSDEILRKMAQSIIDGDGDAAVTLAKELITANMDPLESISRGFVIGVNTVGDAFGRGEAFLPELVMAGEAMKMAVSTLDPELKKRGSQRQMLGKIVIGTVEGDIHEIGKSLVATMLSASGFEVFDLGVDTPGDKLIGKALEVNADVIAMSAAAHDHDGAPTRGHRGAREGGPAPENQGHCGRSPSDAGLGGDDSRRRLL